VPLEERRNALDEQIETLEAKLAEKGEVMKHIGELEKLDFDIEMLRSSEQKRHPKASKWSYKGWAKGSTILLPKCPMATAFSLPFDGLMAH
jgi:hypothetical protein